jgi:molybdopterin/thiamine biosynthesis adenylyltransferase
MEQRINDRYLRQMVLPNFNNEGQKKLAAANVVIIGCGGLGSPVIQYLAAAGVGKITLCDDDRVEITNLNRQILFGEKDIGCFKAEAAANMVACLNHHVVVDIITERVGCHNIRSILNRRSCVVDCTDGLPNKFLINDAAVLEGCPLIHGSAIGYQGRFMVITPKSACLRCFFPEKPNTDSMPSCDTVGILGPLCGIIGSFMATETLKLLLNEQCLSSQYVLINCESAIQMKQFPVKKADDCAICSNVNSIKQLHTSNYNFVCTN